MAKRTGFKGGDEWLADDRQSQSAAFSSDSFDGRGLEQQYQSVAGQDLADIARKSLSVQQDKDGKARWLFMRMPADVAAFLQFGLNTFLPFLNDKGASFVYDKTAEVWSKNLARPAGAHAAGLNAAKIFSAALVGIEPLDRLVSVRREYVKERREIMQQVAAITPSKTDLKQNEVLNAAMSRVHDGAMDGLKRFAAQLPSLAGISTLAVMDYGKLKAVKSKQLAHKTPMNGGHEFSDHDEIQSQLERLRSKLKAQGKKPDEIERSLNRHEDEFWERLRVAPEAEGQSISSDKEWKRTTGMGLLAGVSGLLSSRVGKNSGSREPIALDMITSLAEEVESNGGSDVSADRVIEIFQQNERDHGRPVIGRKLLPQLEPLAQQIADVISDGRLNPLALIRLVGDNKVVIHGRDGSRRFAKPQQVEALIDEQLKTLSSRELMSAEEFFANFADPKLVEVTLKKNLSELKGLDKALFASLFPDDILERAGIKRHEREELRSKFHREMYAVVAAAVLDYAKKDPEQLKKAGLSDEEVATLQQAAEQIEANGLNAAKQIVDGKDKSVISAVRTAVLGDQMATGENRWTERVSAGRNLAKQLTPSGSNAQREITRRSGEPSEEISRV
ncbi:MAG: hypothetical protein SFW63_08160 [Alphaproteobacteria bacterium]|nr:hypothetical protein [Alphaproteobacteria bacterium]